MRSTTSLLTLAAFLAVACARIKDIPTEFPTPEPAPRATPLAGLELKRDAVLEAEFAKIAEEAKGKVGVAAVVLETGEAAFLNAEGRYPMQSVYKLPIALAVMEQVRLGKLDVDEIVGVTPADFVRKGMASPLRDKNPKGGEFTIRELIRLALVESDGTASDVLMRVAGGPSEVQSFLTQIGITDMKVVNTEKELGAEFYLKRQYDNWAAPTESVELLRWLETSVRTASGSDQIPATDGEPAASNGLIVRFMADSVTGPMPLKRLLPRGAVVAHKTGTSGTTRRGQRFTAEAGGYIVDGVVEEPSTPATNDIGIIYLPDGNHLAIAVFVSDSPADEKTRAAVIAKIAKAAYDRWSKAAETVQPANFNTRHTLN